MINLYVYGAGGLGKEVTSLVRRLNRIKPRWAIQGFLDDNIETGTSVSGLPVLGSLHYLTPMNEPSAVVLAISDPKAKRRGYDYLSALGNITFPTLVDPLAYVEESAVLGEGCILMQMCSVSVDSRLGMGCFVNYGTQIAHDCTIGDFVSIMPSVNISGNVTVADEAFIGVQASIRYGLSIGKSSIVGMCSMVLCDVPDHTAVIGQPAVIINQNDQ